MTTEPTRKGYSFVNPGVTNTEILLNPSSSPVGSAIAVGDWMVVVITGTTTTTSITPPAGWTTILSPRLVGSEYVAAYGKIRASGETSYSFVLNAGGTSTGSVIFWGSGADTNLSNWIVGVVTNRASSGGSATNWAESLTTTVANTLALTISTERTSAATPSSPTYTGATAWFHMPEVGSGQIQTIDIGYIDKATAGATGRATINYGSATQTTNGLAFQLAIPPVPDAAPTGLTGVYVDTNGVAHNGYLFYNDASNVKHPVSLPTIKYKPYTVSEMLKSTTKAPWFAAHRGGSYNYPEEVLDGYRGCAQRGVRALEISVQYSADGTPWCFHDSTTNRTTGVSGTISAMTDAQLAVLSNLGSTAAGNPTQRSRPVAKFVDVIAQYKDTHVLIVEDKTYTHQTAFLNLLDSYGTAGRPSNEIFVVKIDANSGQSFYTNAMSRGYKTWGYIFDADMASKLTSDLAKGMTMIGLDYNSSDATLTSAIAQAKAANIKPTGHIVPSRSIRDRLLGLGMEGIMMSNIDAIFN